MVIIRNLDSCSFGYAYARKLWVQLAPCIIYMYYQYLKQSDQEDNDQVLNVLV